MTPWGGRRHLALVLGGASLLSLLTPAPGDGTGPVAAVQARRDQSDGALLLVVNTGPQMIYLVDEAGDTIFAAPVATGMERDFSYGGQTFHFATPRGRRRVIGKTRDPIWTVPDWHYYEKAVNSGLEPVHLYNGDEFPLSDGTRLAMKDGRAGRINHLGIFAVLPIGIEIIFDGQIFIPPLTSPQRKVPGALGSFKLDLGDGYLIHGTTRYTASSIGRATTHGCIRMRNDDLRRLYELVPVGTPVDIL